MHSIEEISENENKYDFFTQLYNEVIDDISINKNTKKSLNKFLNFFFQAREIYKKQI